MQLCVFQQTFSFSLLAFQRMALPLLGGRASQELHMWEQLQVQATVTAAGIALHLYQQFLPVKEWLYLYFSFIIAYQGGFMAQVNLLIFCGSFKLIFNAQVFFKLDCSNLQVHRLDDPFCSVTVTEKVSVDKTIRMFHFFLLSSLGIATGTADCTVHRSSIQCGLPGIPEGKWNQPRRPQPEGIQ